MQVRVKEARLQPGYEQAAAARAAARAEAKRAAAEAQAAEEARVAREAAAVASRASTLCETPHDRVLCSLAIIDERSVSFSIDIL